MGDGPNPRAKHSKYSLEDGKLVRNGEFCPEEGCGPGIFLAIHKDLNTLFLIFLSRKAYCKDLIFDCLAVLYNLLLAP